MTEAYKKKTIPTINLFQVHKEDLYYSSSKYCYPVRKVLSYENRNSAAIPEFECRTIRLVRKGDASD